MHIFRNGEHYASVNKITKTHQSVFNGYKERLKTVCNSIHFKNMYKQALIAFESREKRMRVPVYTKRVNSMEETPLEDDDLSSRFVSNEIKNDVYSSVASKTAFVDTFSLAISNVHFNVSCIRGGKINEIDIDKLCSLLYTVVPFLLNYSKNLIKSIDLCFVLSSHKKTFNRDFSDSLTSANINSGFTQHGLQTKRILVYRKEECFKVLIHELIHAFSVDFGIECDLAEVKDKVDVIKSYFNVHEEYNNGTFLIEESYTEFWASLFYTLFYSVERSAKYDEFLALFSNRYSDECIFSLIKINNIIKYNTSIVDLQNNNKVFSSSLDSLFKNPGGASDDLYSLLFNRKTKTTNTSLIEYYVVKTIMMVNIDHIFNAREDDKNVINISCSQKRIIDFLSMLERCIKANGQRNYFSNGYKEVEAILKKSQPQFKLLNTLCMTTFC